ncbi:expressed unknown protein [Seminavis robusta]|uniref:Nucleotide-diphospho-sugar transferase domain-containing protein n=1 Tax=Seminavis robusta TaxID=568900 RepID=A0A9N8EYH1_9STRA|nr:expressed unknown protein [Seminavis robusta]|eukprot:Sro1934_g306340.1 n/a (384) ;mRNA; f:15541-16804
MMVKSSNPNTLRFLFGSLVVLSVPYIYVTVKTASEASLNEMAAIVDSPRLLLQTTTSSSSRADPKIVTTAASVVEPACDNFFTVLASAWIPSEGNCSDVYKKYHDLILEHDASMARMNKKLTIFTTWSPEELQQGCGVLDNYVTNLTGHVQLQQFDPEPLLLKHGFTDQHIDWMKHWKDVAPRFHHAVTRLSDVFRIVLQREFAMAYADLDLVYLLDDPRVYLTVPNVAVPIWSEEKGAFEIQNSAFCFSQPQLDRLIGNVKALMNSKGETQKTKNSYMYTAFGPNLFQHSLQGMQTLGPIQLYYTHSDDHWKPQDVAGLSKAYGGFVWLHLDASNRRRNWYQNKKRTYTMLVDELKSKIQISELEQVLPAFVLQADKHQTQQ